MGKYSLGELTSSLNGKLTESNHYINEDKCKKLIADIDKNLNAIEKSMLDLEKTLNKALKDGVVTGSRIKIFKSWARKCKSQATSAIKLKEKIAENYDADINYQPIQSVADRINELENMLAQLEKEKGR
ncbi:MAG: hypothetical protein IJI58_05870 [Bacilli bacterium]|nr:hypothetical protein [Bacilli bacterium]